VVIPSNHPLVIRSNHLVIRSNYLVIRSNYLVIRSNHLVIPSNHPLVIRSNHLVIPSNHLDFFRSATNASSTACPNVDRVELGSTFNCPLRGSNLRRDSLYGGLFGDSSFFSSPRSG